MATASKSNQPCISCGSSDGMAIYPTGDAWCFSCTTYFSAEKVEEETGFQRTEERREGNVVELRTTDKVSLPLLPPGSFKSLETRKISRAACEKFGVTVDDHGNIILPYCDSKGNPCAQKIRTLENPKGYWRGNHKEITLFGQQLFKPTDKVKNVTLVVGEMDVLATFDMMGDWPVMSIPDGDATAVKYCKANFEALDAFDKIVLCFDMDESGQKAAKAVAQLFMKKTYFVKMPLKDANACLQEGRVEEFKRAWWGAQKYTPESIDPLSSLRAELFAPAPKPIAMYPWEGLNKKTMGMRGSELVVIKAPPKIGKSSLLAEIASGIHRTTTEPIGLIYLEETPRDIIFRLAGIHLNKPLHFPDVPRTEQELQQAFDYLTKPERYHFLKHWGACDSSFLLAKMRDFVIGLDCKFILFDHISMAIADESNKDERIALDRLVYDIKELTMEQGTNVHMVTHVNDDGKPRGSRVSLQACNILIDLKRDIMAEDKLTRNTTDVFVEANRKFGLTGKACSLYYYQETGRMLEIPEVNKEDKPVFDTTKAGGKLNGN